MGASFSFSTPYITATYGNNAYPSSIPAANRTATIVLDEGLMGMSPMVVYWQETDLSLFDPEYATKLASKLGLDFTPTGTAAVTAETASPPDRSQPPSATSSAQLGSDAGEGSSQSDLSIGAKAGIGVGVAIAVILAVVVGLVLYRRRVRKQRALDQTLARQNEQPELVQTRAA
ncbi:uncharacterized protein J4E87_009985 [Alternaria ethzedia]|uniref:uncharacterized protein n=1 Tax=Alternaria ethzedia TaxID=181014 RepID=UPI0020C477DA|nr:uncharacterized protein J4E87_009985 [Alternaria ethzedia]KAI4613338.1 hypothetical protein J4E87_009985 [Alternaria ethzedia]